MTLADRRVFRLEEQTVVLPDFPADGWILDVGGGGLPVIGRLKADQVIAVDLSFCGQTDVPDRPWKLEFPDCSYNTVTAFFIFLSIPPQ